MKLTKEQYENLPEALKALYVADGDGYSPTFKTAEQVEEEVSGLKANNQKLVDEKRAEAEKRTAAEKAEREARDAAARKNGDIEALDASWQQKFAEYDNQNKGKLESYHKQITALTLGSAAKDLSSKLFGKSASIMQRHIEDRLSLEEGEDGALKVRVLKDGKPSALTLEDLDKEFRANADFAPFLAGTPSGGLPKGNPQPVDSGKPSISMTHTFGTSSLTDQAKKIIDAMPSDE